MAVDYRSDRDKWGFQKFYRGRRWKRYQWDTEAEAQKAYDLFLRTEFEAAKRIPQNCLVNVVNDYLIASQETKSRWRVSGLSYTFMSIVVPHFGPTTPIAEIDTSAMERFFREAKRPRAITMLDVQAVNETDHSLIICHGREKLRIAKDEILPESEVKAKGDKGALRYLRQPVKPATLWHYFIDLRALFNYALKCPGGPLVESNPCDSVNRDFFKGRKVVKPPLNPDDVDRAAETLPFHDRIYFDHLRFTGARKDEGNRTEWKHLFLDKLDDALCILPGTKTEESLEILPITRRHAENLLKWRELCPSKVWVFPSCAPHSKNYGAKTYGRQRMFRRIEKETGIKLAPKDLRDYFCNEVAAHTDDPIVLMNLMRHKSLTTTTKYTRRVLNRMREAVENVGAKIGGEKRVSSGIEMSQNSISDILTEIRNLRASIEDSR